MEAEKHVLKAVQDPSATSDDYLLLARVYGVEKKSDKAKRAIEKAAELGAEQIDLQLSRADLSLLQSDLPGALSEILAALKASPDNSVAHAILSFVYFQQGNFDKAAKEAERAQEL